MKYYRVEPLINKYFEITAYGVQRRHWGVWRTLRQYPDINEAFIHLDSLNRGETYKYISHYRRRLNFVRRILNPEES